MRDDDVVEGLAFVAEAGEADFDHHGLWCGGRERVIERIGIEIVVIYVITCSIFCGHWPLVSEALRELWEIAKIL